MKLPFCYGSHLRFLLGTIFISSFISGGICWFYDPVKDRESMISRERIKVQGSHAVKERIVLKQSLLVSSKQCADLFSIGCFVYLEDYFSRISFLRPPSPPRPFSTKNRLCLGFSRNCSIRLNACFVTDLPSLSHQLCLLQ